MMKFKLIKTFPGFDSLNEVIEIADYFGVYTWYGISFAPSRFPEFWQEIKMPITTTEDGVELYNEQDVVFGVLPKANWQVNYYSGTGIPIGIMKNWDSAWKYFSTKEAAEEYVYQNKPLYSKKDLNDFMKFCVNRDVKVDIHWFDSIFESWKLKNNK